METSFTGPAQALGDQGYNSRRVATDGTYLGVAGGSLYSGVWTSNKMLLFALPNATAPPAIVTAGSGAIQDFEIENGWGYVASNMFSTVDLTTVPPTIYFADDRAGEGVALAVAGNYAC